MKSRKHPAFDASDPNRQRSERGGERPRFPQPARPEMPVVGFR